ncbi:MAG: hypothetical protein NTW58_02875 [Actinobacteria bacterium]|nr:hypothetical protein [Actinomycetota bacterium]
MSDSPTSLLHDAPLRAATTRHEEMMVEARRIVDAGNDRGLVLRLTGGLAVRHYAIDLEFAERDYSDIDLIGLARQAGEIGALFGELRYLENPSVATATLGSQRQYFKRPRRAESHAHMHKRAHFAPPIPGPPPLDHVDVFLDWMKMDHALDFRDRLDINTYAIDPADLFLSKLQIQKLNEKDVHDVVTLCKDVYVDFEPRPGVLDLEHVADTCARDWGLYIDVMTNIDIVLEHLVDYDLSPRELARIGRTLELAQSMMTEHTKTLRWRLRSRLGKRLRWYNEVEGQFAGRSDGDRVASRGVTGAIG